jgi:predicted metal-dependent RNase
MMQPSSTGTSTLQYAGVDLPGTLALLRTKGGLRHVEIARLIDVRPETVARWNHARSRIPQPRIERRLMELEYVVDDVAEFFPCDKAREWLMSPQQELGGAIPIDLFRTGRTHEVLRVLSQMRQRKELAKQRRKQRERDKADSANLAPLPHGWRSPLINPPMTGGKET